GVALRERPAAEPSVGEHRVRLHQLDDRRALRIPELPEVEVARLAVEPLLGVDPAEEDVARGLRQPLTLDHALAVVRELALAHERLEHRRLRLLRLQEQRIAAVAPEQEYDPRPRPDAADADDLTGEVDHAVPLDQLAAVAGERTPVRADELVDPLPGGRRP